MVHQTSTPFRYCGLCAGGNIRLVAALAEGVPIMYNSPVREIRHCSTSVAVHTPAHEFRGAIGLESDLAQAGLGGCKPGCCLCACLTLVGLDLYELSRARWGQGCWLRTAAAHGPHRHRPQVKACASQTQTQHTQHSCQDSGKWRRRGMAGMRQSFAAAS